MTKILESEKMNKFLGNLLGKVDGKEKPIQAVPAPEQTSKTEQEVPKTVEKKEEEEDDDEDLLKSMRKEQNQTQTQVQTQSQSQTPVQQTVDAAAKPAEVVAAPANPMAQMNTMFEQMGPMLKQLMGGQPAEPPKEGEQPRPPSFFDMFTMLGGPAVKKDESKKEEPKKEEAKEEEKAEVVVATDGTRVAIDE